MPKKPWHHPIRAKNSEIESCHRSPLDAIGSITHLTDSTGTIRNTYRYDSFGSVIDQTSGGVENSYAYARRRAWNGFAITT